MKELRKFIALYRARRLCRKGRSQEAVAVLLERGWPRRVMPLVLTEITEGDAPMVVYWRWNC